MSKKTIDKIEKAILVLEDAKADLLSSNLPQPLAKKRIVVAVGHSRPGDFGADCKHCDQGTTEYAWNLVIGEELRDLLVAMGAKVLLLTQYGDNVQGYMSYSQAMNWVADKSELFRADVAIELHANSSVNDACGFETLITGSTKSKILGSCLQEEMAGLFTTDPNRGVKERSRAQRGSGFLYRLAAPCAIVEPIFLSNKQSWNRWKNEREAIDHTYASGIRRYFEKVDLFS